METSAEIQDADLISRVRAGDKSAFGVLFERHHEAALHVATRITSGSRLSADDCVSEAFAQILSVLQRGKGPDEFFRAYLYTVMRNLVQNGNKTDAQSLTVDDFDLVERLSQEEGVDPVITRFETEVVRNAYASLPERWQAVLWYSDIEEMKPAEVAPLLGLSSHGVSMLRARAREGARGVAHCLSAVSSQCGYPGQHMRPDVVETRCLLTQDSRETRSHKSRGPLGRVC